jgi:3',5'-cyclic AMP phosphodiesterase CpdA
MRRVRPLALAIAALSLRCGAAAGVPPRMTAKLLPEATPPANGHVAYIVGGDSRGDEGGVLPWAFDQAKRVGARGFIFLGDMEWSRRCDGHFHHELLGRLAPIPFYPVLGNHEIRWFGWLKRSPAGQAEAERDFQRQFLGTAQTRVGSRFSDHVVYSVDLEKGLHFIALDNVSEDGFGAAQKAWLREDLLRARKDPRTRFIVVGMHKPLAGSCIGSHSMEEGKATGRTDTDEVLAMFRDPVLPVDMILASHVHQFAQFEQAGIRTYVTGGLGAHLRECRCGDCKAFHHLLELDVSDARIEVSVVGFPGRHVRSKEGDVEDDGEVFPDLRCAQRDPGPPAFVDALLAP